MKVETVLRSLVKIEELRINRLAMGYNDIGQRRARQAVRFKRWLRKRGLLVPREVR